MASTAANDHPQLGREAIGLPTGGFRGRRAADGWLDRWIETVDDLARLQKSHPMVDAVIDEQRGRQIRIGDRWLADWASCNYLGLDLDEEVIASVPEYISRWGTHPSWSRLLGSPRPSVEIEDRLRGLLGCEDVLTMPTITHIHMSVIPVLAGDAARSSSTAARTRRSTTAPWWRSATAPSWCASATTTPTTSRSCCAPRTAAASA